jgi:hypothetical protein
MTKNKGRGLGFIFWILMIILSLSGLLLIYILFKDVFIGHPFSALFFIFSWFCLILTSISFYKIIFSVINKNDKRKNLEENINDFYRYQNLSQPPDSQMYN